MIWIIGGTSEAVALVRTLQNKLPFVVTVATDAGREFLRDSNVITGRMKADEMVDFIRRNAVKVIVDLSHPYAFAVSENARQARSVTGTDYIRYSRQKSETGEAIILNSLDECLLYLQTIRGTVFFTTGSNAISRFESIRGSNRFVYRVLPTPESMEECRKHKVALRDIVAALGPFSIELNQAMFKDYLATVVIMKNSGEKGGTVEKLEACRKLKITPVIIDRNPEKGYSDLKELAEFLLTGTKR